MKSHKNTQIAQQSKNQHEMEPKASSFWQERIKGLGC